MTFADIKQQNKPQTNCLSEKMKVKKVNDRSTTRHERYTFCYLILDLEN